jgi:transcriptional regulator with XRE-family HTH domain
MAVESNLSTGQLLQSWRKRRRMSQLELALTAQVSARHVSFLETGRSQPSREMLLHLAGHLDIPRREQNMLLLAAGLAPHFSETPVDDQRFADVRGIIELILRSHEPYPAVAIDRHWNVVMHNHALEPVLSTIAPELREPPINLLRLSLHPGGIAPRTMNYDEWRAHLLLRLQQQIDATGDPVLLDLKREAEGYPHQGDELQPGVRQLVIPLVLQTPGGVMRFYTTTMVFGSPVDITLSELAIETFLPADAETAAAMRR